CHKSSSTFELKQYPPLDTPYVARVGDMLIAPPGYNTYQWYWNLQKLPDGKTRTLRIERAGNYILEVTDSNWCSLRTGRIVVDPPVGDIRIMPNPTDDAFFIESNFEDEQELLAEIYDLTGRLIMTRKIAAGQGYFAERISIGRWTAGLYILRISNNNISKIFKIIKL
ncbi:MAG: T9SS type A sorting domain-containing protein, partial [Bacteroidota bacterium]